MDYSTTTTTAGTAGLAAVNMVFLLAGLALILLIIIGNWKVFTKAGQPGWASIVPIYGVVVLLRIIGRPWWWLLLLLVPLVNVIVQIMIFLETAKVFGKDVVFGICLILFPYVCLPILGFGSAQYVGPAGAGAPAPTPDAPTPPPAAPTPPAPTPAA